MKEFVASDGNLLNTPIQKKKKPNKSKIKKNSDSTLKDLTVDLNTLSSKDLTKNIQN